jgi:nucleoside-diphosphate-sugar epimerase
LKAKKILITGGAGFVGSQLATHLSTKQHNPIVVFDKLDEGSLDVKLKNVTYVQGNLTNHNDVVKLFEEYGPFDTIYHLASEMPNKLASDELMWKTNVVGTSYLAQEAVKTKTQSFIFTSSNVTYGIPTTLPVTEETPTKPLEAYGKSKVGAERALAKYKDAMNIQIFRCPVITGRGRLGLQAILYGFISEGKNVYVLGGGNNRYQFVDVDDIVTALVAASLIKGFDVYTIGADYVLSLRELYEKVISYAGSSSKIVSLPAGLAFFTLWILDKINYSPLGIYQITMMGRSIYADTTKVKKKLHWKPKKTNVDTFIENYTWYVGQSGNFSEIGGNHNSPNKSVPKMGILKLIKFFS